MLPVEYDAKAIKRLVDKTNNVFASGNATLTERIIDLSATSSEGDATNAASIVTEATVRSDADSALASLITTLSATSSEGDATNAASIVTEATARSDGDSAIATTVTTLAASTSAADTANAASVVAAATAASSATSALTNVVNAQRSLFGAAVSDTWDATKQYIGSTQTIDSVDVAAGEEAVKGGLVYRCRATHTNQQPPSTSYWDLVDTVAAVVSASVLIESNTRASEDNALANSITALTARVGDTEQEGTDNAADIVTVNTAIANNKSAQSKRNDTLAARFGVTTADNYDSSFTYAVNDEAVYNSNVYRCILSSTGNLPTSTTYWTLQELLQGLTDARIETLEDTYADRTTALSTVIQTLTADVGANSVAITTTNTAFAAVDATLSQSIQDVITDLAETDATVDGEIVSFFQDSAPTGGHIGDIWFDTDDNNTIYTWKLNTTTNAYAWVATPNSAIAKAFQAALDGAAIADGKAKTFYSSDAPVNNTANNLGIGDLWVDEDTKELFRWTGASWLSVRDTTLTQVIQGVAELNATVDGEIVSFFQNSAPSSNHIGDIWFDTNNLVSEGGYTDVAKAYVRRDNGSGTLIWVHSPDSALVKAFRDTSAAQDTADGKITAFYNATAPSTADSGDLWVDTDDNQLYRWDASLSTPAWVSIRDNNLTSVFQSVSDINGILDGQIVSFFQNSAPSSTHVGDFWFDTNDIVTIDGVSGAQPYVRLRDTNGDLQWVTANNSALAKAFRDTSAAQDTADGKITSFYQNAPPSTADSGDLWVDTNNENKLYRWDASLSTPAWASVQDGNIVTLLGKYGVNIDANGYIIGYDIFNDGTNGSFKIKADEFRIVEGSTANETGTEVFSITNGDVTINGSLVVNGSLSVAGKASIGSVGAISGTAGNDVTMTSYSEISQTNFVNAAPQHIAAANHSDGSVSAGDVMGGTPLYSFTFTTYAFSGTKDFIISTLLDPIGYYGSASSTGFAFAMKATTSATDYASTSASAYVSTKGTSKGGTLASQNYILSDVVSLSGSTQYYIWVFGVMDDVGVTGGQRGIRDGQITVAGLNV